MKKTLAAIAFLLATVCFAQTHICTATPNNPIPFTCDKYGSVVAVSEGPLTSVSTSYNAKATDSVIFYSGVMDGTKNVTLPLIGVPVGHTITIKVTSTDTTGSALNVFTGNNAEYVGNPQLYSVPGAAKYGGTSKFVWDGTAWWMLYYHQ